MISRSTSVDVTETDPQWGPVRPRISIRIWWRGKGGQINVENQGRWLDIVDAVNTFGPLIGWKKLKTATVAVLKHGGTGGKTTQLTDAIARQVNLSGIAPDDYHRFLEVVRSASGVFAKADDGFAAAFAKVVARLPNQPTQALEELSGLLESWSLLQITGVSREVKSRLATLGLFKSQIEADSTYEIQGDKSIHRVLENAMWLLDERYWLLQSNSSLRKFIGTDVVAKGDGEGKLRPDFVCGSVGDTLIIVEIKRPANVLEPKDLNQLESYFAAAEKFSTKYKGHDGYLVGRSLSDDLRRRLKFRRGFHVLTYSELIEDTERRYKDYLKFLKNEPNGG